MVFILVQMKQQSVKHHGCILCQKVPLFMIVEKWPGDNQSVNQPITTLWNIVVDQSPQPIVSQSIRLVQISLTVLSTVSDIRRDN